MIGARRLVRRAAFALLALALVDRALAGWMAASPIPVDANFRVQEGSARGMGLLLRGLREHRRTHPADRIVGFFGDSTLYFGGDAEDPHRAGNIPAEFQGAAGEGRGVWVLNFSAHSMDQASLSLLVRLAAPFLDAAVVDLNPRLTVPGARLRLRYPELFEEVGASLGAADLAFAEPLPPSHLSRWEPTVREALAGALPGLSDMDGLRYRRFGKPLQVYLYQLYLKLKGGGPVSGQPNGAFEADSPEVKQAILREYRTSYRELLPVGAGSAAAHFLRQLPGAMAGKPVLAYVVPFSRGFDQAAGGIADWPRYEAFVASLRPLLAAPNLRFVDYNALPLPFDPPAPLRLFTSPEHMGGEGNALFARRLLRDHGGFLLHGLSTPGGPVSPSRSVSLSRPPSPPQSPPR